MSSRVVYSNIHMERNPVYQRNTQIVDTDEGRIVRKCALSSQAFSHVNGYMDRYNVFHTAQKKNDHLEILKCENSENGISEFPFLPYGTLSGKLHGMDEKHYIDEVNKFIREVDQTFETVRWLKSDTFDEVFGNVSLADSEMAWNVGFTDLQFDHIFISGEEKYIISEYEWLFPFLIPKHFVIYAALSHDKTFQKFSQETQREVLKQLNIDEAHSQEYQNMMRSFDQYIASDDLKLECFTDKRKNIKIPQKWLGYVSRLLAKKPFGAVWRKISAT